MASRNKYSDEEGKKCDCHADLVACLAEKTPPETPGWHPDLKFVSLFPYTQHHLLQQDVQDKLYVGPINSPLHRAYLLAKLLLVLSNFKSSEQLLPNCLLKVLCNSWLYFGKSCMIDLLIIASMRTLPTWAALPEFANPKTRPWLKT